MVTRWMATGSRRRSTDGRRRRRRVRRAKMRSLIWRIRFAAAGKAFRSWRRHVELSTARDWPWYTPPPPPPSARSPPRSAGGDSECDATEETRAREKGCGEDAQPQDERRVPRVALSVRDKADKRALVGRVVARMTRVKLASAWDRWETAADVLRAKRARFRADRFARRARRTEPSARRRRSSTNSDARLLPPTRAPRVVAHPRVRVFPRVRQVDLRRRRASTRLRRPRQGRGTIPRVLLSKTIRAWYFACDDGNANAPCSPRRRGNSTSFGSVVGGASGEPSRGGTRRTRRRGAASMLDQGIVGRGVAQVDVARRSRARQGARGADARRDQERGGSRTNPSRVVDVLARTRGVLPPRVRAGVQGVRQDVQAAEAVGVRPVVGFRAEVEARKETLKRCVTSSDSSRRGFSTGTGSVRGRHQLGARRHHRLGRGRHRHRLRRRPASIAASSNSGRCSARPSRR